MASTSSRPESLVLIHGLDAIAMRSCSLAASKSVILQDPRMQLKPRRHSGGDQSSEALFGDRIDC